MPQEPQQRLKPGATRKSRNYIGYKVNQSKQWVILKDKNNLKKAEDIFKEIGIKFTPQCINRH